MAPGRRALPDVVDGSVASGTDERRSDLRTSDVGGDADGSVDRAHPVGEGEGHEHGDAAGPVRHRNGKAGYRLTIVFGLVIMIAAGAWQLNATLWTRHSEQVGKALVQQFESKGSTPTPAPVEGPVPPGMAALATCAAYDPGNLVKGLLVIPKLAVTAPVEEGIDNAQLDVAVGHNPNSVWPGSPGNAVLAAHDVSYFTNLPQLATGDTVEFVTSCTTTIFAVTAHSVVTAGTPVYNTNGPTLTMVTCWPTNALWFTSQRYLVTAEAVSSAPTTGSRQLYEAAQPAPSVAIPADLASQGVTLATYSVPMGSLAIGGTPDKDWAQTTAPLLTEGSGVQAFIAGVKALTQNRLDWWSSFAPGVTPPAPLVSASNPSYASPLQVTVTATGKKATGVTLSTTMVVSGGPAPGHYQAAIGETVSGGTLTVSSWTMTPA